MNKTGSDRYHLMIKIAPHQQWERPSGWTATTRQEAIEMGRRADRQWMRVQVIDSVTGESLPQ